MTYAESRAPRRRPVRAARRGQGSITGADVVSPEDLASDDDLSGWVEIGIGYARSLPPKQPAKKKPKK